MIGLENINPNFIDEYKCNLDLVCTELTMAYRDYFYLVYIGKLIKDKKGIFVELHHFIRHIIDLLKNDLILHMTKLSDKNGDFVSITKFRNDFCKNWIGDKCYLKTFYKISDINNKMEPFLNIRNQKIAHAKSELDRSVVNKTITEAKFILEEYRKCYNSILLDAKITLQDLTDEGIKKLETNCEIGCQLLDKNMLIPCK